MSARARSKSKARRDGVTLQLPSHVQNSLNKEERVLQQTLLDIDRETKHRLKCISQDQQVAARKLTTLERRLLISQSRSPSAVGPSGKSAGKIDRKKLMSRMDTCDSSYFKSLMTPLFKDTAQNFEEDHLSVEIGASAKKITSGLQRPPKSALKKGDSAGSEGRGDSSTSRKKSVSFNSRRVTKFNA